MYIRYRMNLWLPVTHWTNSKIGMLMSILALARPAVAVPRKSEACPKHGIRTSFKHFFLKHLQKRKLWKILWFRIRRFDGHASLVSDTSSTLTFPVGWLLDVPLWCKIHRMWTWRTSRATEKTTWCKDMQISWLFGKISVKHVFFEDPCRVGQWRTT